MFALMNSWEKSSGDSLTTELIRYVGLTYTLTVNDGATMLYLASKRDCDRRALKSRAAPSRHGCRAQRRRSRHGAPGRKVVGSRTSRRLRKKIEMRFAHLRRILKLDRLRLRGPNGARGELTLTARPEPPQDGIYDPWFRAGASHGMWRQMTCWETET
jgi:hypothetical protein